MPMMTVLIERTERTGKKPEYWFAALTEATNTIESNNTSLVLIPMKKLD
jgi:hypothetical protein